MARIRSLKPEMWQSESVGRLSREARLLFIGIITQVDDDGRTRASSRGLASLLFPFDDDAVEKIDGWLSELDREGIFIRYLVDGATYGYLPKFKQHQKIDKPSSSKLPAFTESLARIREDSRKVAADQGLDQGLDQGKEVEVAKAPVKKSEADFLLSKHPFKISGPKRAHKPAINEVIKIIGADEADVFLSGLEAPLWPDRLVAAAMRISKTPPAPARPKAPPINLDFS